MTISDDDKAEICGWIRMCFSNSDAKRMQEQEFARRVNVLKYASCIGDYDNKKMRRDLPSLNKTPVSETLYSSWEEQIAKHRLTKNPLTRVYAALIAAQSGFYLLNEDEYRALQDSTLLPQIDGKLFAKEMHEEMPLVLKNASFDEFKTLVAEVLTKNQLPVQLPHITNLAVDAANVLHEGRVEAPIKSLQAELEEARARAGELNKRAIQAAEEARHLRLQADAAAVEVARLEGKSRQLAAGRS